MLKKLLISGCSIIAGLAVANAGNISISNSDLATAAGTLPIVDFGGALVPAGSGYVAAGTFRSLTDAQISAAGASQNWGALLADFAQFGAAGGVADFAGIVTHDASAPLAAGDAFVGKPIYVAVGNTASVAGDPASANQWLVYKAAASFEADNPVFGKDSGLSTATANQILVGSLGGPVQLDILGGASTASLQLAGVPEPSTALLLLSGLGSMVFFRRRR